MTFLTRSPAMAARSMSVYRRRRAVVTPVPLMINKASKAFALSLKPGTLKRVEKKTDN